MKTKRKHIEDLILLISPDTDVHLFPKRDLLGVLKHEILHLLAQKDPAAFNARTDAAISEMLARETFGRHILAFPIHKAGCPATDGFGCRCNG